MYRVNYAGVAGRTLTGRVCDTRCPPASLRYTVAGPANPRRCHAREFTLRVIDTGLPIEQVLPTVIDSVCHPPIVTLDVDKYTSL